MIDGARGGVCEGTGEREIRHVLKGFVLALHMICLMIRKASLH